jgi:hypothetical protein
MGRISLIHRTKTRAPTQGEVAYEGRKAEAAETAAQFLWGEYQKYTRDPQAWTNNHNANLGIQLLEYQVVAKTMADNNAHFTWLKQNQPERLPPVPLWPKALEFTTSTLVKEILIHINSENGFHNESTYGAVSKHGEHLSLWETGITSSSFQDDVTTLNTYNEDDRFRQTYDGDGSSCQNAVLLSPELSHSEALKAGAEKLKQASQSI